ncbi:MAG: hypothetical protein KatS3mg110_1384 [Pirellulaceae bacterium]|nr:MAG: hypothetical protein KatS3mg110_1384 [Pirellulaceae bacterium]
MQKMYIVRSTDNKCRQYQQVIRKFNGTSQMLQRAPFLLKLNANGPVELTD